jgi:hypothetical protein
MDNSVQVNGQIEAQSAIQTIAKLRANWFLLSQSDREYCDNLQAAMEKFLKTDKR